MLIVLGSGQDGGSPQLGTPRAVGEPRTASSVAVLLDESVLLLDVTPDVRHQWTRWVGTRADLPASVFVTHAHMGHYAGLVQFGREAAATDHLPLWAPRSVLDFLEHNEPWATLLTEGYLRPNAVEDGPMIHGRIAIHAVPVPHRAEFGDTVAYSIRVDGDAWALYLPDIDGWDRWPDADAVVGAHHVALIDATFGYSDELPHRNLEDIPHPHVIDTIERFAHLTDGRRIILTHLNHSNRLADPGSDLRTMAERAGFEVASDGMEIRR